jgi:hypothetical protein
MTAPELTIVPRMPKASERDRPRGKVWLINDRTLGASSAPNAPWTVIDGYTLVLEAARAACDRGR